MSVRFTDRMNMVLNVIRIGENAMKYIWNLHHGTAKRMRCVVGLLVVFMMLIAAPLWAQGKSAEEVAKELANPNNSIAKLTFKNRLWMFGVNITPVVPNILAKWFGFE